MAINGLTRWTFLLFIVLLALGAASPARAGTFVAWGPQLYTRATGAPAATTASFSVRNPNTTYTLFLENNSVSSAIVTLNGSVVFDTSDFNQRVTRLEKAVTLAATNTLTVELRGGPEDSFSLKIVGVDNDLPTIRAVATPPASASGWNGSDVTVVFTCDDATSGVAVCPPSRVVSAEGAAQQISGTATDNAGNVATATVTLNIDKSAPVITITSPANNAVVASRTATISGTASDTVSGVAEVNCGTTTTPVVDGVFACTVSLLPGNNTFTITASDRAGNAAASAALTLRLAAAPTVHVTAPENLTFVNISPITVRGTVSDPAATVRVGGIAAPLSNGLFSVQVPLVEGNNTITAVAETPSGFAGTANVQVTLDTTPPHVAVHSPPDGFVTSDATIAVSGLINDIVVGTVNEQQASVTVNSIPAQVANRSFVARNVSLAEGENLIQVVGRDRVGNAYGTSITVRRISVATQARIRMLSGDGQRATMGAALPLPVVAEVMDAAGHPAANQLVVFKVTQSDGTLADAAGAQKSSIVVTSDAQGRAQARWTLGKRAGAGNNRVEATATGYAGTALFSADAVPGVATSVNLDAGSEQIGAAGEALPFPFVVVVTDAGFNRLGGVAVTFTVTAGGGTVAGSTTVTRDTDSDGRALAVLTLGSEEGYHNNVVAVTVPGSSNPIVFTASAKLPGAAADTKIAGTVLDNSNAPLAGVTVRLYRAYQASNSNIPIPIGTPVVTDAQGQFVITSAPVGAFKLVADGTTVQRPNAAYPSVEYDIVTVSGQTKSVGMPIYLPALDTVNRLCVSPTVGGTLQVPAVPGLAFTVAAGSATFPGGSRTGCITVTPVHGDKVPMVPGFGQQPRFVITIQPAGTHFSPPAQLAMPNVDGLAPRQVTEMYSYDHDLSTFIAIGTGTVSADGSVIKSDPGVGVLKAGWHCGGNPNPTGAAACCPPCQKCTGKTCVADDSQTPKQKSPKDCEKQICKGGSVQTVPDLTETVPGDPNAELNFCITHPIDCIRAKLIANDAEAWAKQKAAQGLWSVASLHNGIGDAARHAYWNCLMASQISDSFAKELSDTHEKDTGGPCDERDMDQTNNQTGRNLAKQSGDCQTKVLNNLNILKTLP